MRKLSSVALALTVGVLVSVGSAVAARNAAVPAYTVHMTGAQERPTGSPKGAGTFKYQLVLSKSELCYVLIWSGIGTPYAAHVHMGVAGIEGPIVLPLSLKAPVAHSGCVKAKKSLLQAIQKKPSDYYVNVHTKKYPGGAIRGQLP